MSSKHTFWESHVAAWLASGQTQSGYCHEQGLSLASFGYWRHKLRGEAPRPAKAKGVIPIVPAVCAASPVLEIGLPNRLTVRVPVASEPARIVAWIEALAAC